MAATPGGAGCCVLGAAHAPWGAGTLGTRARPAPELLAWSLQWGTLRPGSPDSGRRGGAHLHFKMHFCVGSKKSRLVTLGASELFQGVCRTPFSLRIFS